MKTVAVGPLAANLLADSIRPAGAIIAPLEVLVFDVAPARLGACRSVIGDGHATRQSLLP